MPYNDKDYDGPDDRRFYRHHVFFNKADTLDWLLDRGAVSPEDDIIAALDGDVWSEPPVPTLDGLSDDLVWIWHCRESGMGWKDIAPLIGLKTPAGAWKRFQRLLSDERKKAVISLDKGRA